MILPAPEAGPIGAACGICRTPLAPYATDPRGRRFLRCPSCLLICRSAAERLDVPAQIRRYSLHQNTATNDGYVRMLKEYVARPVTERLAPGTSILDFGCGPSPLLLDLLKEAGFATEGYDLHFRPDTGIFDKTYDAVILHEVIEHLEAPADDFLRLKTVLRPGGLVFVRTRIFAGGLPDFLSWWYIQDETHVSFFGERSVRKLAEETGFVVEEIREGKDILFRKPAPAD